MLPEFKTILYATDLSPRAPEVFRYAMSLAQKYGAKIHILHAVEPLTPFARSMVDLYLSRETTDELHKSARDSMIEQIRRRLDLFCTDELCTDPEGRDRVAGVIIDEGRPADLILREAERLHADLIVMGSHGHTAVGEILLGTTAHRVMQRAAVPVFLVRMRKK